MDRISKIGPHVYVKGGVEAVKIYKEAFGLEDMGSPVLDHDGYIYHHILSRDGGFFISVSEVKYMQAKISQEGNNDIYSIMSFTVAFDNESSLWKAYDLLYEEGNPCTGLVVEPGTTAYCDVVDKFGVYWCLYVPKKWESSFVPK